MANILVIKLGSLGDVIFVEGLFRTLRAHHAGERLTLLTEPAYAKLLAHAPYFDDIVPITRPPRWQFWKFGAIKETLRAGNFDVVYDLQNSARSHLYTRWMDAKISCSKFPDATYAFDLEAFLQARTHNPPDIRTALAAQLAQAGIKTGDILPDWRWAAEDVQEIMREAGLGDGFVLLMPGSSARNKTRRWQGYGELARILKQAGVPCASAPGPDEMDLCRGLDAICLLDEGKPLRLAQLIGLARHVGFVVGNNSGPSHLLACARAKAGLMLFERGNSPPHHSGVRDFFDTLLVERWQDLSAQHVADKVLTQLNLV